MHLGMHSYSKELEANIFLEYMNSKCFDEPVRLGRLGWIFTAVLSTTITWADVWTDPERGAGVLTHSLQNHKWLLVSLKILVWTPLGSNCYSREVRTTLCEIRWWQKNVVSTPPPPPPTEFSGSANVLMYFSSSDPHMTMFFDKKFRSPVVVGNSTIIWCAVEGANYAQVSDNSISFVPVLP